MANETSLEGLTGSWKEGNDMPNRFNSLLFNSDFMKSYPEDQIGIMVYTGSKTVH